ncbi:zinc finger protein 644a isoform X1 [Gambusia affinis]|uniref:zinc finger protein 644a isoform X1 n=2 Tax=Gambusia affinis TaxID=33528 RepID=UPI001CDB9494|nr:zinc finger protein 644a isoform X1 [Gambusia affinis]
MPSRCIAAFCSNTREDGVSLFRFPKEPELLSKWVKEVRRTREHWKPTPTSVLCSEHFELHCFDFVPVLKESLGYSVQHKRVLLPTAVPTVFPSGTAGATPSSGQHGQGASAMAGPASTTTSRWVSQPALRSCIVKLKRTQVMAMEVSCLTGVDEDEKDADSEIQSLMLLQPVKMAQDSASCTDSFDTPSLHQNNVLDVLSRSDMLSPIGLANGPSLHQATQAHELHCITSEKDEEKSITQLKTVQEIDSPGIWGFDTESAENSLDDFSSASDLNWDPHKEFMQFLLENHDSPAEEPKEEVGLANSQRRRKRKMDMVVMVDPSEDLYPDLSPKTSEKSSDAEGYVDSGNVRDITKSQKLSTPQSSTADIVPKYPNGTVKVIKQILYKTPARSSHGNNINDKHSTLKGRLKVNSHSQGRPLPFPCSKCNLVFKKEHRLFNHMKSHNDPPSYPAKPFICRECGKCFKQSNSLIDHMSTHEKKTRLMEEEKDAIDKKKEDAKLFCPQCPFGTSCPDSFVQHAKTHEKDKRRFKCDKCSYRAVTDHDLRRHSVMHHTVIRVRKRVRRDDNDMYPCEICSYKAFGKQVFVNHLILRHQMSFEEYTRAQKEETNAQHPRERKSPGRKTQFEDANFTSKISVEDVPDKFGGISDLFKNSKFKRDPKSQLTESKLDKSINVLLSRQNHRKTGVEQKDESNNSSTNDYDSNRDKDGCDESQEMMSVKVEEPAGLQHSPNFNLEHSPVKKSQSKRKMSTPYRNTSDQDSCFILPKPSPSPKKVSSEDVSDPDEKDIFPVKESEANGNHFSDVIKKEKKHIIYTYSRRMSMRGALQASKKLFEKIKTEGQEQNEVEIKEECIETEVFQETFEAHQIPLGESPSEDLSEAELDTKKCPYCPAVFESGIGLSNHVRGHLHRVRVGYDSQHGGSPQEVGYQDKRPRIRRKNSTLRRLKKALQDDSDSETVRTIHSCPLCGDSFDNRTGQSNHIRGHLKKLGRNFSTKTKSPLILLRELMRDKKECQRAFQILGKRRNHFQYGALPKLPIVNRFASSQMGFPKSHSVPNHCTDAKPLMPFSLAEGKSESGQLEKLDVKTSLSGTNALIGILKKRKCQEDARQKGSSQMSRNGLPVSSNPEESSGSKVVSSLPNSVPGEKGEFNRKVCIHCNATFHSGVSLSNHLRAFAKRQQIALLEGTTIQCKAVRTRSRPGLKKKTLPLAQSPEEMYRLTCRFCDLVFQGPLSVQEDWIKHLQRHIMNTGVPRTGLGMAEVTSLSTNPPTLKTDEDGSSPVANAAS